jgi:hypothetical protein
VWSQQPWPYPSDWEEWQRRISSAAPVADPAGRRCRIEVKRRPAKRVRFPVRGGPPSSWQRTDQWKKVPDGVGLVHDFVLWKREYPFVTWETWWTVTVQVEYWLRSDRNMWDWFKARLGGGDGEVLLDAHEYTFGDRAPGTPVTSERVTEWRWVRSSEQSKTPERTVGAGVSAAGWAGGTVERTVGGLETGVQLFPAPERQPGELPWREGLEYRPEDELQPGRSERMPANTEYFDLHVVVPSGRTSEPEVEVLVGDLPLGKVRPNQPLRVPLRILPDPDAPAWPPWGVDRDVPVSPPGYVLRGGPPTGPYEPPPAASAPPQAGSVAPASTGDPDPAAGSDEPPRRSRRRSRGR